MMACKASPLTIMHESTAYFELLLAFYRRASLHSPICVSSLDVLPLFRVNLCVLTFSIPAANPTFTAVSSLSPVSTHVLMPASLNLASVSGTLSYRLSCTAVEPITSRSLSTRAYTFSSFRRLLGPMFERASCSFALNCSYSSSPIVLSARTSVRRPFCA